MSNQRENYEKQVLLRFENVANKYNFQIFSGQRKNNRIPLENNTYFQFGDLRVETESHHVLIEVESAGGVTNLVKYWYCLDKKFDIIKKPVVLLHVFRQTSLNDIGSHLDLWDFLWSNMHIALGKKINAKRFTYRNLADLEPAIIEFEDHVKGEV